MLPLSPSISSASTPQLGIKVQTCHHHIHTNLRPLSASVQEICAYRAREKELSL
jgi:hypothetical protein